MEENGRLIKFLYNEDREVVAEETSNGTITRYIRGLGIISSDSEEAKTYYHYVSDAQGSITHVLTEDAEILNHYNYDAFGNIIEKTEQVENRFCYNGEMLDPITQQYYLRARFYNPVIGRFTQEDTYYGDGLNLYQYCQANPVGYVDPSGHNCGTTQSRYNSDEKQHPKANAAGTYEAVTGKNPLKKDAGKTSYGKSSGKYDTTADFLTNIENRNGKFYTDKATIDKIGQVEARGEDFSPLNKRIMSSRASTEGGTSVVYKYSDELGTKYLIHEVTDARGYIIHRDFDAVRISSGQLINKGH